MAKDFIYHVVGGFPMDTAESKYYSLCLYEREIAEP